MSRVGRPSEAGVGVGAGHGCTGADRGGANEGRRGTGAGAFGIRFRKWCCSRTDLFELSCYMRVRDCHMDGKMKPTTKSRLSYGSVIGEFPIRTGTA